MLSCLRCCFSSNIRAVPPAPVTLAPAPTSIEIPLYIPGDEEASLAGRVTPPPRSLEGAASGTFLVEGASRPVECIKLKNGSDYFRHQFNDTILFKLSKKKDEVFSSLADRIASESFSGNYEIFLDNLKKPDWYAIYQDKEIATEQSYFSIYAYLSGDINREELLVINTVGAAYDEIMTAFKENPRVRVIEQDRVVA